MPTGKRRCQAVTIRGTRCTSPAVNGSGRCNRKLHNIVPEQTNGHIETDTKGFQIGNSIGWLLNKATDEQFIFVVALREEIHA